MTREDRAKLKELEIRFTEVYRHARTCPDSQRAQYAWEMMSLWWELRQLDKKETNPTIMMYRIIAKLEGAFGQAEHGATYASDEAMHNQFLGQQQGIAYAIELVKYAMKEENQ